MSEITDRNTQVKIIGLGSPAGLDALGWRLVQALPGHSLLKGMACVALRDPAMLPSEMHEATQVVLIDAGVWAMGEVRILALDELAEAAYVSSHALSIAEAIRLTEQLNPALRVSLIGVGVAGGGQSLEQLLRQVLPEVIVLIEGELGLAGNQQI